MCGLAGEESQSSNTTKCHLEARRWRRCKFIQMHKKLQRESLKLSQLLLSLQFIGRQNSSFHVFAYNSVGSALSKSVFAMTKIQTAQKKKKSVFIKSPAHVRLAGLTLWIQLERRGVRDDNNEDIIPKISALFTEDNHSAGGGLTGPLKTRGNSEVQLQGNPAAPWEKTWRQLTAELFRNAGFGWI